MTPPELVSVLLGVPPASSATTLAEFWEETAPLRARVPEPVDRAILGGFHANRLGFAFASGYQASLHVLVPGLPPDGQASFCVTEAGGNHPRAIQTTIDVQGAEVLLRGEKKWCVAAANTLVVVGTAGSDGARPKLRAVRIDLPSAGVTVSPTAPGPFVPEVLHATLTLDGARLPAASLLSGDGYDDYTKPFRTIEDLHVQAALLGYLSSVAARFGFPDELRERLLALVVTVRGLAAWSPKLPETHVALAGFLAETAALVVDLDPSFSLVPDEERERWQRDRVLVQVASKARALRRERAWEALRRKP